MDSVTCKPTIYKNLDINSLTINKIIISSPTPPIIFLYCDSLQEVTPPRRSSVATPPSRHQLASPVQEPRPRSRSPSLLHRLISLTLVFEVLQSASSSLCSPKECCHWRHTYQAKTSRSFVRFRDLANLRRPPYSYSTFHVSLGLCISTSSGNIWPRGLVGQRHDHHHHQSSSLEW